MPSSASSTNRNPDLIDRLNSSDYATKLKALREVKNQIIGNKTKKLSYVKLGAVPTITNILVTAGDSDSSLLVQSAAAIGSFACGVDVGVKAVLDSGVLPHLFRILSNPVHDGTSSRICHKANVRRGIKIREALFRRDVNANC